MEATVFLKTILTHYMRKKMNLFYLFSSKLDKKHKTLHAQSNLYKINHLT